VSVLGDETMPIWKCAPLRLCTDRKHTRESFPEFLLFHGGALFTCYSGPNGEFMTVLSKTNVFGFVGQMRSSLASG